MPNMGKGGEVGQQSKFRIHMGLACGRAYTLDGILFLISYGLILKKSPR